MVSGKRAPLLAASARGERFWLAIGFAVLLGLMALQTFLSLRQIEHQREQLKNVIEIGLTKFNLVGRMHAAGRERILLLQRLFMTDDPFEQEGLREAFGGQAEVFIQARQALLALPLSEAERALIERQGALSRRFHEINLKVFDLLSQGQRDEAVRLFNERLLPTQYAVLSSLTELYELQQGRAREIWTHSDRLQREARRLLLVVAALVFLIALAVAYVVFKRVHEASTARERLATYDLLTGLPNRLLIGKLLNQAIARAQRHGQPLAVMFVDLDGFKAVNDTLGHHAGDLLLVEVARRLEKSVRKSDTVGRLAGDEFVVLLEDIGTREEVLSVAEKIRTALVRPITVAGREARVSASIGIALYPENGQSAEELLHKADAAMYAVKQAGRDAFQLADDSGDKAASL